ncbi:MAG TPA: DUF488 family protein [Cyclobacteriaceae bacterium]|nr:DUF488 family protein [Cyclobacteriaceae bacterium]
MYYRRKVLLSLIEAFGGQLQNTDFQKLLFAISAKQASKTYHFVPYKFGSYSFQSIADKSALIKYGYLEENEKWRTTKKAKGILNTLKPEDKLVLREIKTTYEKNLGKNLVRSLYLQFPYYAIKSEIAATILTADELKKVEALIPTDLSPRFFTIGYEGISLEEYLNKLINSNVRLLCDVRKNALSQKFGFSKNQLSTACKKVGIAYIHIPELGIPSDQRQTLSSQSDYEKLFDYYDANILPARVDYLATIQKLISEHKRVAITCFEACEKQCHRGRVAKALSALPDWNIPITHL